MNLVEWRQQASESSGGTSPENVRRLVTEMIRVSGARGKLLDFGAGKGELLRALHGTNSFQSMAGIDLFERPLDMPKAVAWYTQDLNGPVMIDRDFDVVICSETIEHLENPREVFRSLHNLLRPEGTLILTMPNQESIRAFCGLLFGGHFTLFLGACYPAHITALLRLDLVRICAETGFSVPQFFYSNSGSIPKFPAWNWQGGSLGILRGRLFSDNLGIVAQRMM